MSCENANEHFLPRSARLRAPTRAQRSIERIRRLPHESGAAGRRRPPGTRKKTGAAPSPHSWPPDHPRSNGGGGGAARVHPPVMAVAAAAGLRIRRFSDAWSDGGRPMCPLRATTRRRRLRQRRRRAASGRFNGVRASRRGGRAGSGAGGAVLPARCSPRCSAKQGTKSHMADAAAAAAAVATRADATLRRRRAALRHRACRGGCRGAAPAWLRPRGTSGGARWPSAHPRRRAAASARRHGQVGEQGSGGSPPTVASGAVALPTRVPVRAGDRGHSTRGGWGACRRSGRGDPAAPAGAEGGARAEPPRRLDGRAESDAYACAGGRRCRCPSRRPVGKNTTLPRVCR